MYLFRSYQTNLLTPYPMILSNVRSLLPGTPAKIVTERSLRPLLGRALDEQLANAKKFVRGSIGFVAQVA